MSTLVMPEAPAAEIRINKPVDELRERTRRILRMEIDFLPNAEFEAEFATDTSMSAVVVSKGGNQASGEVDLPTHLKRMCDAELLGPEQERHLFREMNRLKYHAHTIRSRIDPDSVDPQTLDRVEALVAQARMIRDHLIQANMRLVISIVKKFVTPQQSFDELLSEGVVVLMKAVEKFDFDRGFRFSTYAYRSIVRQVYRTVTLSRKEEARFTREAEEWAFEDTAERASGTAADRALSNMQEHIAAMLGRLDRRERFIIRSRYALGSHRRVRTFQYLADKLGVSKERVRQLEARAVAKLRSFVADLGEEDPFAACVA